MKLSDESATLLGTIVCNPGLTVRQLRERMAAQSSYWEPLAVTAEAQRLIDGYYVLLAPCAVSDCCGDGTDVGRHLYATLYFTLDEVKLWNATN